MIGVKKQCVGRRGEKMSFSGGGGINIVLGPKYRTLAQGVHHYT
jgi:hypothetical protein